jgi:hypothetical protein
MRLTLGRIGVVAGVMATAAAVAIGASTSGAGAAPAAPAARQAAAPGVLTSSATGSFTDAVGGAGKFAGTFTPQRFSTRGGQLLATGVVTGTLVDSAGSTLGSASQTVTTAVLRPAANGAAVTAAACQILDLNLAPLDLNLLGLVVHLDRVHLNITAQTGPGNLLGNLLCAVAHLLDQNGLTGGLQGLLNQILAILGGL